MPANDLAEQATRFRHRHTDGEILRLPNAWDAASAAVCEQAGAEAVATTSIGIAASLGHSSGRALTRDQMVDVVERIADTVRVPVSADVEHGYGETPAEVHETVTRVLDAGAVGFNLEDGARGERAPLRPVESHSAIVEAARNAAEAAGVPALVNARTDVFWLDVGDESTRVDRAVARGNAYLDAGADCVFVPGVTSPDRVADIAQGLDGPLNVLGGPGTPSIDVLESAGVARVTVGAGPMRAALHCLRGVAQEFLEEGSYDRMGASMSFEEFVAFLKRN